MYTFLKHYQRCSSQYETVSYKFSPKCSTKLNLRNALVYIIFTLYELKAQLLCKYICKMHTKTNNNKPKPFTTLLIYVSSLEFV